MSEARMARASLKKTIAYASELLTMIKPEEDLEGWIQAKITDLDHSIESVYSYYKFGDDEEDSEEDEEQGASISDEEENESMILVMSEPFPKP